MTHAMSEETPGMQNDLPPVHFATSKAFARGYDSHAVDQYVAHCASVVDDLNRQLAHAHSEMEKMRARIDRDSRSHEVQQAVSVLTNAQVTADSTIAEADAFSARVMSEAKKVYEDARRDAAILEQETERKARAVYEDALRRTEALEGEAQRRIESLTLDANMAQQRLDGQTAYLRTLRDATRTQMEAFLEGMLNHLSDEYGRAHPIAAKAAAIPSTPASRPRPRRMATGDMIPASRTVRRSRFAETPIAPIPAARNGHRVELPGVVSDGPSDRD
jgi:hypothetical protein